MSEGSFNSLLTASLRSSSSSSTSSSTITSSNPLKAILSRRSLIDAGESFRKAPNRNISVGLQMDRLETLLCETSREYCESSTFVHQICMKFRGLAARKHFSNSELSREELFEIADVLTEILNDAPHLSTRLVAYINSTIGLVRLLLGEHDSAINSFVKALWIMAVTKAECTEEIGLTVQRLGIAHGRIGNFNEAVSLLEKSIAIYRSGGMQESHPCMLSALNELEVIRPKLVQAEVNLLKLHPQSSERARRLLRKTGAYSNVTANELALET